jgi:hypothetical protein
MFFPIFSFSKAQNNKKIPPQKKLDGHGQCMGMDNHAINHAKNHYMDMGS